MDDFFDDGPKPDEIIQKLKDENRKLETELRDIKPKVMSKEGERWVLVYVCVCLCVGFVCLCVGCVFFVCVCVCLCVSGCGCVCVCVSVCVCVCLFV